MRRVFSLCRTVDTAGRWWSRSQSQIPHRDTALEVSVASPQTSPAFSPQLRFSEAAIKKLGRPGDRGSGQCCHCVCTSPSGPTASPPQPTSATVLCPQCQQNLQLKISQLASFQPTSEVSPTSPGSEGNLPISCCSQVSFEEEASEYERSVEKLYPLCGPCEQKVAMEINQRNRTLRPHLLQPANECISDDRGQEIRKLPQSAEPANLTSPLNANTRHGTAQLIRLMDWTSTFLTLTLLATFLCAAIEHVHSDRVSEEGSWKDVLEARLWDAVITSACWLEGR